MGAATTHMQRGQWWAALGSPRWRCWMLVSVPLWCPRPVGSQSGHYLLRLTGRLSLVCACFFLLQPVRLY